jgi:tetratricopeptide (TPR) repeat protein
MLGDLPATIADYSMAIHLSPEDSWPYLLRGNALAFSGNLTAALTDYSTALQLDPANVLALTRRGDAYQVAGALYPAVADYSQAIAQDPEHSLAYLGRADAYSALSKEATHESQLLNDTAAALADYERYRELRPDAPDLPRVEEALVDLRSRLDPSMLH